MRIAIIGSSQYRDRFVRHKAEMEILGNEVRIPAFDDFIGYNELQVCAYNRDMIKWADEIHVIWDQRSMGTVFDFGMVFMAEKPIRIVYIEPKTLKGVMELYEKTAALLRD